AAQPLSSEPARMVTPSAAEQQEAVARAAAAPTAIVTPTPVVTPAPAPATNPDVTATPALPVKIDTRIAVRTNSWVELRDPNGDILAQTYVRAGESYTVPAGISYRIIDAR